MNAWDSQNRLVSCIIGGNTSTYKYGADGLRRQKTTNGATTDYAYDGTMLVREGHATGGSLTATATYFQGASGPCYRRDDTQSELDSQGRTVTKARWYVFDGLGSVVGEVDPGGNLTSSPKYDVYGAVRANAGTASTRQGFVGGLGHVSDDTGLIYMQARYYDPAVGRFTSEDPGYHGVNWYIYASNNPTNRVDADGKFDFPWDQVPELFTKFGIHTPNFLVGLAKILALCSTIKAQFAVLQATRAVLGEILEVAAIDGAEGIMLGVAAGGAAAACLPALLAIVLCTIILVLVLDEMEGPHREGGP